MCQSNGRILVKRVLDLPPPRGGWVQPVFGFCVRPHQPSHKCLFNISSSLKYVNQKNLTKEIANSD